MPSREDFKTDNPPVTLLVLLEMEGPLIRRDSVKSRRRVDLARSWTYQMGDIKETRAYSKCASVGGQCEHSIRKTHSKRVIVGSSCATGCWTD
jgi:hypothetical protein